MASRRRRPVSPTARATSLLLLAMVGTAQVGLLTGGAGYAQALAAVLAVLGTATAVRMWWRCCFESRLGAVVLAGTTVLGQVLATTVGRPGGTSGPWHPAAVAVVALGLAVPLLVALDVRRQARPGTAGPPYAL